MGERTPNVEAIERLWAAYGERDLDSLLALVDPDVEWREAVHLFERGSYSGHDGIRRMLQENEEVWPSLRVDLDEAFDAGDGTVVAIGCFRDESSAIRFVHVCRLRDGKLVELTEYEDAAQVSAALNRRGSGSAGAQ